MAAQAVVFAVLILAMAGHSSKLDAALPLSSSHPKQNCGTWCVCKDGLSDAMLQKTLDYACGAGADCNPIRQNGACYNPNTVRAHCSYAVNSYFQRKNGAGGTCDFAGTATVSASDPSSSGCAYPASASAAGTSTTPVTTVPSTTPVTTVPSTTPTTPVTPVTGTTPTTTTSPYTTPTTATPTGITPSTGLGVGTGLGPTAGMNDDSYAGIKLQVSSLHLTVIVFLISAALISVGS
ncbi:hypothetical protein Ancab_038811 [Ancistrocladus abbreviatus]